jgi:glycosyltransferase involved in cell wall biosynthesis
MTKLSIVIPAKNEAQGLSDLLDELVSTYPEAEVIVVDDGSTDETAQVAAAAGARVISPPTRKATAPPLSPVRGQRAEIASCSWTVTVSTR